jgi:putative nucleotidyltransferase with HDIG domain
MLVAGQAAVCFISLNSRRSAIIGAGAGAAAAGALTIAAIYMVRLEPLITVLVDAAWVFGSHVIATVLCVGTLSVWESLFDIATDARLHELCNTNNPLLKQLVAEAPGTYQHSVAVASLAENAAQAIGANGLLSRVCGYYHDVGKLRRPLYFKENQKPNENIHDTLHPQESAAIITAHTKDGVTLLNKYKFPSAVTKIVSEHHGNTMAAYFYYKAVQQAGGRPVAQKPYRYTGARPSSKESAIVMLADSCEAAVRSIPSPSWEAVEEMVHKVIRSKVDDGQLALCPLTMLEMTQIENSFLRTLNGLMHERIEYPESKNAYGGN